MSSSPRPLRLAPELLTARAPTSAAPPPRPPPPRPRARRLRRLWRGARSAAESRRPHRRLRRARRSRKRRCRAARNRRTPRLGTTRPSATPPPTPPTVLDAALCALRSSRPLSEGRSCPTSRVRGGVCSASASVCSAHERHLLIEDDGENGQESAEQRSLPSVFVFR